MRQSNFKFIFIMGLVSGTFNSIVMKLAYQTAAGGSDMSDIHFFHKPWFMSIVMFLAMLCALPLYYMTRAYRPLPLKTWLFVSVPSVCDLFGSSMQQVGLIFTPVSVFQMLKGSILLFSAALSVLFLNKRMYIHNWIGVGLCVLALMLVGFSSVMAVDEQPITVSAWEALFGITIVVLGQIVCASQYVVEEFLLKPPNDVSAMAMVGMEGLWGTLLMGILILPLFQYAIPGSDVGGVYENSSDTLAMISNSESLQILLTVCFVSVLIYNVCGVMVTQQASAVHHTFLDATRTIFVWVASVAVYYHPGTGRSFGEPITAWSGLQLIGFVILLMGECVYDGILVLPRWISPRYPLDSRMSPVRIPSLGACSPYSNKMMVQQTLLL